MKEDKYGTLNLWPLYKFLKDSDSLEGLNNKTATGRAYGKKAKEIVDAAKIPQLPGFYLWGKYDNNDGSWHDIYVGMTQAKTGLYSRILEELKDERSFIWLSSYSKIDVLDFARKQFPPKMKKKYETEWTNRHFEKAGSTHIVWFSMPKLKVSSHTVIELIESNLIAKLGTTANKKIVQHHTDTDIILKRFKLEIEANMDTRYKLPLV